MKSLTKIFTVLVALLAVACTTDVTEDVKVQVGDEVQTTLTLSLEETRTQLGTAADGLYPVTWCEDDVISINGVPSTSIAIADGGKVATFTFNGSLAYPYEIAYPAAAEGKVVLAEQQTYTEGTFANGAAAMYGYAEESGRVTLNYLTGVLKIGVTGNKTITYAQISTADRAPIAGEFGIDFTTGELKAGEASKELISYSFGEGLKLGAEAQYIHVAVPAGVYDEVYVTLYDTEGGVMYATVKADDSKPLKVGMVREFTNTIPYAANDSVFVIRDKASLKAFAEQAPTLDKNALFVADVDMTGEAWTPIEGYTKTIIGNGYAIKGLTAPLFGTTSASFRGLHLREVNINETVKPNVGAFARIITANDDVEPTITHCSAEGTLTIDCKEYVYANNHTYREFSAGGLTGHVDGAGFSNCVNRVNIIVKQMVAADNATDINHAIGGISGALDIYTRTDKTNVLSPIEKCENYGSISFSNGADNGETGHITAHIGGVIGVQYNKNFTTLQDLVNRGSITLDATVSSKYANVGGVIGYGYTTTATRLYNYGDIVWNSGEFYGARLGGVFGYTMDGASASHLYNDGNITVKESVGFRSSCYVGGCIAVHNGNTDTTLVEQCKNTGDITIDADQVNDTSGYFRIGGVIAWCQATSNNLENSGNIAISSRVYNAHKDSHYICIGGCVAYKTVIKVINGKNTGNITFTGKIDTKADATADDKEGVRLNMGGILGYSTLVGDEFYNEGDITVDGATIDGQLRIGGIVGHGTAAMTMSSNSGNVTVKGKTTVNGLIQLGGIAGYICGGTNLSNSGALTIGSDVTVGVTASVGGSSGYNNTNALDGFVNTGAINVQGTIKDRLTVGGCVATPNVGILNCTNKGSVTVNATMKLFGVGGVIGYQQADKTGVNKVLTNEAPVSVSGTATATSWVGGVIGNINMSNGQQSFENKATGVVTVAMGAKSTANVYVGGGAGLIQDSSTGVYNYAPMNISGNYAALYIGGAVASHNNYNRTDSYNYGDITISVTTTGGLWAGGLCAGGEYGKTWSGAGNYGNITVTKESRIAKGVFVGGIYGKGDSSVDYLIFDACENKGNITVSGTSGFDTTGEWELRIGGLSGTARQEVAGADDYFIVTNGFTNTGNITYDGAHTGSVMVGGVIGQLNYWSAEQWTGFIENKGTITCTGTFTTEGYVGGVAGGIGVPFANGVATCTLIPGSNYTGAGMLTGTFRTETLNATGCRVGGIFGSVELGSNDYQDYLYGGGADTDWTGSDDYDGCRYVRVTNNSAE